MSDPANVILFVSVFAIFVYSVILHEIAHGYAAFRCGDPTAFMMGRLSLNPVRHIDPIMTIFVPLLLFFTAGFIFGGAKPVPVNPRNFRSPVRDDIIVSLAGVVVNLFLALFFVGIAHLLFFMSNKGFDNIEIPLKVAYYSTLLNLVLVIFNLLPIPPLDGSHVFKYLLPPEIRAAYTRIGFLGLFILILFIQLPIFNKIMYGGIQLFLKLTAMRGIEDFLFMKLTAMQ